jgi:CDP-diacylglycerol--glycerol-3-phosphate 3-phosphatidyltransferase
MHEIARLLFAGVLAIFGVSLVFMAVARPALPERVARYGPVLRFLGRWMYWWAAPLVRWLDRRGFGANHVTWLGFGVTTVAAVFAGQGWWGLAGLALTFGGLCDIVDGELARRQGAVADSGAFLDSTLDRLSELALFGGMAAGFTTRFGAYWAYAAVAASILVSYARARGEGLGVTCPHGGMERPHRILVLMLTMLSSTLFPEAWAAPAAEAACGIVAVGAGATAIGRMSGIWSELRRREALAKAPPTVIASVPPPQVQAAARGRAGPAAPPVRSGVR